MLNALTVDVEDWANAYLDNRLPITDAFVRLTDRVLEAFDEAKVKGTFFVLGELARDYPAVVRTIGDAGHELGVHGWRHTPLWESTPDEFAREAVEAKDAVEQASGSRVAGFRAPYFSIVERTRWALPLLAEAGFTYDSSLLPASLPGKPHGLPGSPAVPHRTGGGLIEFPVTTLRVLRWRVPAAGGGYLRVFPMVLHTKAIEAMNEAGAPGVLYLHPHDLDPTIPGAYAVKLKTRTFLRLNRSAVPRRLSKMLSRFSFAPMGEVLSECDLTTP